MPGSSRTCGIAVPASVTSTRTVDASACTRRPISVAAWRTALVTISLVSSSTSFTSSGSHRLYVPPKLPGGRVPLVVLLHGGFGTGAGAASQGRWDEAARREGFVTVAPDGIMRSWNAGGCCGPPMRQGIDDVGFVLAVL